MGVEVREVRGYLGDYLRQKGLPLRGAFRCLNPEHEDRHPSMSYNARAGNVHCFSCGATYDLIDLVGLDYGIEDFPGRYEKACELFGLDMPVLRYREEGGAPWEEHGKMGVPAGERKDVSWFSGRGISPESVRRYGLFIRDGRAYFPVEGESGDTGWCARALEDGTEPKYLNSPGPLGIWNGGILERGGEADPLFVTEGIADAIVLEQLGFHAVSLCGSQNTGKLLRRLQAASAAAGRRFVACGDPDPAGIRMNEALKEGLEKLGAACAILPLEEGDGDINRLYLRDSGRLRELCAQAAGENGHDGYSDACAAAEIDSFFAYSRKLAGRGGISTGFPGMDRMLDGGVYPGLYVLGAISSLGKTGFLLQIAEHIAGRGNDVLFFSLEQSRFELIARSLSRLTAVLDTPARRGAVTARQLLGGTGTSGKAACRLLEQAKREYGQAARNLFIREGIGGIGGPEIRGAVLEHRDRRGKPPVVMVDYLQILSPSDPRATDKQNTDRAVVELKRLSRDFDTPVLAVSSFNRENYRAAVSMEAFKESGAVEYSSDVLLGLQLEGAGSRDFDVNRAKSASPRRIELVLLKNRNGIPYSKIRMRYVARFGLFEETED